MCWKSRSNCRTGNSPHAPPLRGSLPPKGADSPWGGPAMNRRAPTLRRCAGRSSRRESTG
ncbi:hypothetical protein E5678_17220 [Hydrogenophaga sp. PAMC20947]|nr:hypothetical protein E5678_17220 [Hydrogenophaga sp. PAMC20947]